MRAALLVLLFSSPLALNADVINAGIIGLTGGGSFEWNSFIPGSLISFTASGTNGLHTLSMNISVDPVAYFPSFVGLPGVLVGPDELVPTGPAAGACYWTGTVTIDSYSNTSGGTQCVTADWSIGGGVGTVDIYQLVFTGVEVLSLGWTSSSSPLPRCTAILCMGLRPTPTPMGSPSIEKRLLRW